MGSRPGRGNSTTTLGNLIILVRMSVLPFISVETLITWLLTGIWRMLWHLPAPSHLFCRLKKPISLCLYLNGKCSTVCLPWTCCNLSACFLYWGSNIGCCIPELRAKEREKNCFPRFTDYTSVDAAQYAISYHCFQGTLLTHVTSGWDLYLYAVQE